MSLTTLGIASDHGGRQLKQFLIDNITNNEQTLVDLGVPVDDASSVDYPDYASALCQKVASGELEQGILVCGTGIGMSIAANKWPGIRAALVWDNFTAQMSKEHNNAQILCLGERVLNFHRAAEYVKIWLEAKFAGDRHQRRLDKIARLPHL